MKLIHYQNLPNFVGASVVSVGNFDGIHKGHEVLIKKVVKRAKHKGFASIIVTFEPHTRSVLQPSSDQPVLSTLEEKAFLVEPYGVDYLAYIPFNESFAMTSPQDFVQSILVETLRAKEWVMGEHHTFGREHLGNKNFLQSGMGKNHIFIFPVGWIMLEESVVSSTEIRRRIVDGKLDEAIALLGHPYLVSAKRVVGFKRARNWGFQP